MVKEDVRMHTQEEQKAQRFRESIQYHCTVKKKKRERNYIYIYPA